MAEEFDSHYDVIVIGGGGSGLSTAVQAAKIMGLDVAGVDILRSARGPLVLEVNSSPGLQGVEAASGKDVAGKIIEFLELKASRKNKPAE